MRISVNRTKQIRNTFTKPFSHLYFLSFSLLTFPIAMNIFPSISILNHILIFLTAQKKTAEQVGRYDSLNLFIFIESFSGLLSQFSGSDHFSEKSAGSVFQAL